MLPRKKAAPKAAAEESDDKVEMVTKTQMAKNAPAMSVGDKIKLFRAEADYYSPNSRPRCSRRRSSTSYGP